MTKKRRKKVKGQPLPSSGLIELGDVLAVPLADEHWAYIRRCGGAAYGVYDIYSKNELLELEAVVLNTIIDYASCCEPWKHPTWVYLGNVPFLCESEQWPPDTYSYCSLCSDVVIIHSKGNVTRTRDKSRIEGLKENNGGLMPGTLIKRLRAVLGLPALSREIIEAVAPWNNNWHGEILGRRLVYPFILFDDQVEFRIIFAAWDWLRNELGDDSIHGYYFNGYGMEGLVKAVRLLNQLPVETPDIEYNSSGDSCLIIFTDVRDAEDSALLTIDAIKNKEKLLEAIRIARANGFDEG